eukprot:Nk52_evm26s317 gene=Nk52_evmTU26s317
MCLKAYIKDIRVFDGTRTEPESVVGDEDILSSDVEEIVMSEEEIYSHDEGSEVNEEVAEEIVTSEEEIYSDDEGSEVSEDDDDEASEVSEVDDDEGSEVSEEEIYSV